MKSHIRGEGEIAEAKLRMTEDDYRMKVLEWLRFDADYKIQIEIHGETIIRKMIVVRLFSINEHHVTFEKIEGRTNKLWNYSWYDLYLMWGKEWFRCG